MRPWATICLSLGAASGLGACWLAIEGLEEQGLFRHIVRVERLQPYEGVPNKAPKRISTAAFQAEPEPVRLMNVTHQLLKDRGVIFSGGAISLKHRLLPSGRDALMSGQGACGDFSWVLSELLQAAGYRSRNLQLGCGQDRSCHTVVEAWYQGKWIFLDPLNNTVFHTSEGIPASLAEIRANLPYYRSQTKLDFYRSNPLNQLMYTNWRKDPLLMPSMRHLLNLWGLDLDQSFSLRSHFLNNSLWASQLLGAMAVLLISIGTCCLCVRRGWSLKPLGLLKWVTKAELTPNTTAGRQLEPKSIKILLRRTIKKAEGITLLP